MVTPSLNALFNNLYLIHTMNTITSNIIDRDELQNNYVQEVIDGLDLKDCLAMLYDYLSNDMDKLTLNELIEDVQEYYPHLLDNN